MPCAIDDEPLGRGLEAGTLGMGRPSSGVSWRADAGVCASERESGTSPTTTMTRLNLLPILTIRRRLDTRVGEMIRNMPLVCAAC